MAKGVAKMTAVLLSLVTNDTYIRKPASGVLAGFFLRFVLLAVPVF